MDGEFKLKLKDTLQEDIVSLFNSKYGDKLSAAYAKSAYHLNGVMLEKDFCAGHHTNSSLFLVYTLEANTLKIYVETVNKQDLRVMKDAINMYFKQVTGILHEGNHKWSEPQATISLENCPFYGFIKTRTSRIKELFDKKWEELLIIPIASILASYVAIKTNLLDAEDYVKDIKKAVILTGEAYIGLIFILTIKMILPAKKEFTFNF